MRPVPRDLAQLRLQAEAAARAEEWPRYLGFVERLREHDAAWWPHLWAPVAAIAAQVVDGSGASFLAEAIDAGFRQPENIPVEEYLGSIPEWPSFADRMRQPPPPPRIELTDWPQVSYGPALVLDRLAPDRERLLAERLPEPLPTAWATARAVLEWATTRWEHANDHVEDEDALVVLDRAAAGERFACVEYSIVLTQALNAVRIPARRVGALQAHAHVGTSRGHVVSEAWVDDLNRWVVLDGQNGAWWGLVDEPLGLRELVSLARAGAPRPAMVTTARDLSEEQQALWWSHFHSAYSTGLVWGDRVVAEFQGLPVTMGVAVRADAVTHPDLAQLETTLHDTGTSQAVRFQPVHPYATGVSVDGHAMEPAGFDLDRLEPGEHVLDVRTRTSYGELAAQPLAVTRR